MSVPVAGEWLWKRVTFVNPLPLLNVWSKRSKAVGNRALAKGVIPAAFFVLLIGKKNAYLAQCFVWAFLAFRGDEKGVSLF